MSFSYLCIFWKKIVLDLVLKRIDTIVDFRSGETEYGITTEYGEINSSQEKSFPNPSITFGNVFCLSSKR